MIVVVFIGVVVGIFRMTETSVPLPMATTSVVMAMLVGVYGSGWCGSGYDRGKGVAAGITAWNNALKALLTQAEAAVPPMATVNAAVSPCPETAEDVIVDDAAAGAPGGPGHELLGGIGGENARPCPGATGGAGHTRRSAGGVDDVVPVEEGRVADPALPGGGGASSGNASGRRGKVGIGAAAAAGRTWAGTKASAVRWVEVQTGSSGVTGAIRERPLHPGGGHVAHLGQRGEGRGRYYGVG